MRRSYTGIYSAALVALALTTVACGGGTPPAAEATAAAAPAVVQLAPENVATATLADNTPGPFVPGQRTPPR